MRGESLLFLTGRPVAARDTRRCFFAYRGFTADPDRILQEYGYGRAHHGASISSPLARHPGHNLLSFPPGGVDPKQSLNRVLAHDWSRMASSTAGWGPVTSASGICHLTEKGAALERELSEAQRNRMRDAFRAAGPDAVSGFRAVLEQMMDPDMMGRHYLDGGDGPR